MSTATAAGQVDGLLKRDYQPAFEKAFNEEFMGWQLATKTPKDFTGEKEYIGIQARRANGVGFRGEPGVGTSVGLPTPNGPTNLQMSVALCAAYAVFQLSHRLISQSLKKTGAFKEGLANEMEGCYDALLKRFNQYFYGDGRGVLSTVVTGGSLTSASGDTLQITVDTTRYLNPGDIVALWTTAGGATVLANGGQTSGGGDAENVKIQTIDSETTLTLVRTAAASGTATVVANNVVRLFGDSTTDATTRTDNCFTGLQRFADDGTISATFQGQSRSTYGNLKGQLINAAGAQLSRSMLYKLHHKARRQAGVQFDTMIMDLTGTRDYLAISQADQRFLPVKEGDVGFNKEALVLTIGGRPVRLMDDVDVPYGMIFGMDKSKLEYFEASPLQFDNTTGSVLRQGVPYGAAGTGDVFFGYARAEGAFGTPQPAAFGKIYSLDYSLES